MRDEPDDRGRGRWTAALSEHPWLDDVPAYALGVLDPDERAAFDAHLEMCYMCRSAVAAYRELGASLAVGVTPVLPSPSLRERILEEVGAAASGEDERDSMLSAFVGKNARTATLTSSAGDAIVRLFWNRADEILLLAAFDLPGAAEGRTYQLWGRAEGHDPVGLMTFDTGSDASAFVLRPVSGDRWFEESTVSDEPAGGSSEPTTEPLLVGAWEPVEA
ncbi:MAG: anti-sigma factor [Gemmatimonadetes bacterium]|nr:anti-sigma factor [Gemmatimonadota bacterium]